MMSTSFMLCRMRGDIVKSVRVAAVCLIAGMIGPLVRPAIAADASVTEIWQAINDWEQALSSRDAVALGRMVYTPENAVERAFVDSEIKFIVQKTKLLDDLRKTYGDNNDYEGRIPEIVSVAGQLRLVLKNQDSFSIAVSGNSAVLRQTKDVDGLRVETTASFRNVANHWMLDLTAGHRPGDDARIRKRTLSVDALTKVVTDADVSVLGNKSWKWDDAATALRSGFDQIYDSLLRHATTRSSASTKPMSSPK